MSARFALLCACMMFAVPAAASADPPGQISEFSSGLAPGARPTAIAAGPGGDMWFTDAGTNPAIGRITMDGAITEFRTGLIAGSRPNSITIGPDGNMWFADLAGAVGRITPAGVITEFKTELNNPGSSPSEVAEGGGDVWFTDVGPTPAIGQISPQGQIYEVSSGLPAGSILGGITFAGTTSANLGFSTVGWMLFADWGARAFGEVNTNPFPPTPGERTAGLAAGSVPTAVAPGFESSTAWFTDSGSLPSIGKISSTLQFDSATTTEYFRGLGSGSSPSSIAQGPDGDMWFSDSGTTGAIGRVTSAGAITEFTAGISPGGHPNGIAAGPDGNMWFTDPAGRLGRVGTGESPALLGPPTVTGLHQARSPETCRDAHWATWVGLTPQAAGANDKWLLDGRPIATGSTYIPSDDDAGHHLSCVVSIDGYGDVLPVTLSATSAPVTVTPRPAGLHAAFSFSPGGDMCAPQTVSFNATASTVGSSPIVRYRWKFGGEQALWDNLFTDQGGSWVSPATVPTDVTTAPYDRRAYDYEWLANEVYDKKIGFTTYPIYYDVVMAIIPYTAVTLTVEDAAGHTDSVVHQLPFRYLEVDVKQDRGFGLCPHGKPAGASTSLPTLASAHATTGGASVQVTVGCKQGAICGGVLTLRTVQATTASAARARRPATRRSGAVIIGSARFAVLHGHHQAIAVALNKRGRALARAGRLHRAQASITTLALGRTKPRTTTRVLSITRSKGRARARGLVP